MITGDSYIGSNRQHRLSDQVLANTAHRDPKPTSCTPPERRCPSLPQGTRQRRGTSRHIVSVVDCCSERNATTALSPGDGLWLRAPYLHNGSVPTIYQLLLPASRRDTKFWVGTREFDSKNLGLSTQPAGKGGFLVNTSITGNSNSGHEFRRGYMGWHLGSSPQYGVIGAEFTDDERWQIIEYLKSL